MQNSVNPGTQPGYQSDPNGQFNAPGVPQGYGQPQGYAQLNDGYNYQAQGSVPNGGYAPPQNFPPQGQPNGGYAAPQPPAPNGGYATPQGFVPTGNTQNQQAQADYDEGKLGTVFGKDTVLDIKAKLKMPDRDDNSAAMQGKYSVYCVTATKPLGNNQSLTVRHNIEWVDVLGMFATSLKNAFRPSGGKRSVALTPEALNSLMTAQQAALTAASAMQQGQNPWQPTWDAIGFLSAAVNQFATGSDPDYELNQVKVLPGNLTPDGYSVVTSCKIVRNGYRSDGTPARYPWVFTVENFEAIKNVKQNGTTTYSSNTKRPVTGGKCGDRPIVVMASDHDILKLTGKAMRHLLVWDAVANTKRIREALMKQLAKLAERRNGYGAG